MADVGDQPGPLHNTKSAKISFAISGSIGSSDHAEEPLSSIKVSEADEGRGIKDLPAHGGPQPVMPTARPLTETVSHMEDAEQGPSQEASPCIVPNEDT